MAKDIYFIEFVFPKGHEDAGQKIFKQVTQRLWKGAGKPPKPRDPNSILPKRRSVIEDWNQSSGPQNKDEFLNTHFTNGWAREAVAKKLGIAMDEIILRSEVITLPNQTAPETPSELLAMDLAELLEYGKANFPEHSEAIAKYKSPELLRSKLAQLQSEKLKEVAV